MFNEPTDPQQLIEAFFEALRLRHLEQCQELLESLRLLARHHSALKPWCHYLQGVLVFEVQHDWAEAEQIFTDLLQSQLEPPLRERVLYSFGRSLDMQGRWQEAIAAFGQILEFAQAVGKTKAWKHMAISYNNGFTRGDFGPTVLHQAIVYCHLALDTLESRGELSLDVAWLKGSIWNTLGLIHVSLGQWDEAIACYQQDLAICRAQDDRFGMGITYGNLGEVYLKRSSWSEALVAHQQALSLIREFKGRYEEIDVLANLAFLYQQMGNYDLALGHYHQTIDLIEDLRASVSSEAAQAGFFATVVDTYANAVLLCVKMGQHAQAFDLVERARSRAFLDMLATRSPALSQQLEARPLTLAEVQTTLPPDTLLLEYFTTGLAEVRLDRKSSQAGVHRHRFPPAKTLLFAITHDQVTVPWLNLSPDTVRPTQLEKVVEGHFLEPEIQRLLYDKLIAPVESLMQGKRRIYLVPHGPLHYVPFQALLASDGETLLHETGPQLVFAPSATLLCRGRGSQRKRKPTAACLAVGYNSEGKTQLYFAEDEAAQIAHLTHGHSIVGSLPKKAALYQLAADYRLLHFACHGEFNPESPLASFLHVAPDEKLTALDLLEHLRLRCDLVTLSACESGLSRVRRGDELICFCQAKRAAFFNRK